MASFGEAQIPDFGMAVLILLILSIGLTCSLSAFPSCTGEADEENSRNVGY